MKHYGYYQVKVKRLVALCELDEEDKDVFDSVSGLHFFTYLAPSEEEALDEFHHEIPIACLDDFEITCELQEQP